VIPLRLDAPAKINLSLRVVGRRDDRYHLLESVLVLLDLADGVLLMPGCSGIRVDGRAADGVPLDATNLAWRGLVAGLGEEPTLACLTLEKRIPAAAGLGGGSSDAAAAWRLGRAIRGLDTAPTDEDLVTLAAIGADVPFFAAATPAASVGGVGERVTALDPVRHEVVLVHPPFGLATRDVFGELRPEEWGRAENDLLAPARRLRPELDDLFDVVRRAGGMPRLTGSGPTIFVMDDDVDRIRALAARLEDDGLRTTITGTRTGPAAIEAPGDKQEEA
jgi:4-diphosphocytidyl-2-C-methyl-D-erythritol kinase